MTARAPVLRVRDLHVRLHRAGTVHHALRGVDLTVEPGEIVALVGDSGSGSSTLGLALQGRLPVESAPQVAGSIEVDGVEIVGAGQPTMRRVPPDLVGAVCPDPMSSLDPTMRVGDQLAEVITDGADPVELLRTVGIPDPHERRRAYPHELCDDQRQRVTMALAMARRPALVVADEPTTALDGTVQADILQTLRRVRDESGTAFVVVTHDVAVAAATADRIVQLHAGTVADDEPVRTVTTTPADPGTTARGAGLVVEGRGLRVVYPGRGRRGQVEALRGVDLRVAEGESVALVGGCGSGKTTLLRMVAGLVEPTAGTLTVRPGVRPQVVHLDASASLTPWMTVGELVGERLQHGGAGESDPATADPATLVGETLERVGLPARLAAHRPGELSDCQRQRVAVARAIVVPTPLLLCDEPVSAMDVSLAEAVLNLFQSLRRELGMAMLFVTRDPARARFSTDRIVVLQAGRVVEEGPAERVVGQPQAAYTKALLASTPSDAEDGHLGDRPRQARRSC